MNKVKYVTSEVAELLAKNVTEHVNWYYRRTENDETHPLISQKHIRNANLNGKSLENKLKLSDTPSNRNKHDSENSYTVFQALKNLTPHQATDERLWVYLCHTDCKEYTSNRWLSPTVPKDSKTVQKEISHFFVPSKSKQRNLFRSNAVSRLWWMGYLADQVAPDEPQQFLEILLHKQDVAVQVLTRSITQNRQLLVPIYEILKEDWKKEKRMFDRAVFRQWMSKIDIYGGVVLLDALSEEQMRNKLIQFSSEALQAE